MWKLEKYYFLVYYEFQSIQVFLNTLENIYDSYWLTYFTRIWCQIRKYLWQQLLFIIYKYSVSIIECIRWQRVIRFFCCSFSYIIGFPSILKRLGRDNLREKIPTIKNKVSQLIWKHKVSAKPPMKAKGDFKQENFVLWCFYLFILVLNIISFGLYSKLSLFWLIIHYFMIYFSIRLVLVDC
jgi:hypothetical protein